MAKDKGCKSLERGCVQKMLSSEFVEDILIRDESTMVRHLRTWHLYNGRVAGKAHNKLYGKKGNTPFVRHAILERQNTTKRFTLSVYHLSAEQILMIHSGAALDI
jgi:hypothetical protein